MMQAMNMSFTLPISLSKDDTMSLHFPCCRGIRMPTRLARLLSFAPPLDWTSPGFAMVTMTKSSSLHL